MKPKFQRKQPTSPELTDDLLGLIQRKFYPTSPVQFAKDRHLLLKWVVLKFASWLDEKGVTLPLSDYKEIVTRILMDAAAFQKSEMKWGPAYLGSVMESHLRIHGEDYYDRAKVIRNLAENALGLVGKLAVKPANPIREMAQAARLIQPKKRLAKTPIKEQLTLL